MDQIYKDLTKGVRKPKHKLALFLCGAAGSGKTTMADKFLDDANITTTFVRLNIDSIRSVVGTQEAARTVFVHLFEKAVDDGYSIFYDATCRDKSNILARMKQLKEKNYKIVLGITYASLGVVLGRVKQRTDQPLDESVARDIYKHLKKNVEEYMSISEIDEVYLYNNEKTSKLIFYKDKKEVHCISPTSNFYFDISKYC